MGVLGKTRTNRRNRHGRCWWAGDWPVGDGADLERVAGWRLRGALEIHHHVDVFGFQGVKVRERVFHWHET